MRHFHAHTFVPGRVCPRWADVGFGLVIRALPSLSADQGDALDFPPPRSQNP